MERKKMTSIMREEDAIFRRGESQYLGIGNRSVGLSSIERGEHIMTQPPEFQYHRQRDVLIGIKPGHYAASFSRIRRSTSAAWERA